MGFFLSCFRFIWVMNNLSFSPLTVKFVFNYGEDIFTSLDIIYYLCISYHLFSDFEKKKKKNVSSYDMYNISVTHETNITSLVLLAPYA